MKISNSKKELARIISENGGWRDGAEWAAQDKDWRVSYFDGSEKPVRPAGEEEWWAKGYIRLARIKAEKLLTNWHSVLISRVEYFHLYPAPDADGWIEWKGGECPVEQGALVDIKDADGVEWLAVKAAPQDEYSDASNVFWEWNCTECNRIVACRLHNPENNNLTQVDDINVVESKPTIEQLAADYRNAKDYAERRQQEADAAKVEADAKLAALVAAGKEYGLLVSPITAKQGPEPELVIKVQVGDEVECVKSNVTPDNFRGAIGTVLKIDRSSTPYLVDFGRHIKIWCYEVKFIRRP